MVSIFPWLFVNILPIPNLAQNMINFFSLTSKF